MKRTSMGMLLLFSLCLLLVGCGERSSQNNGNGESLSQYYVNTNETKLISQNFSTDKTEMADLITAVVENLKNQESTSYVTRLLPPNVSIRDYYLDGSTLILDMSSAYEELESTREILTRAGLVKSFDQIDGVDSVQILIEGQQEVGAEGSVLSAMTSADFVEAEGREIDAYQYGTFTLYFADEEGTGLKAEKRKVYYSTSIPKEREVMELLLRGPASSGLKGTMPAELKILNVTLSDNTVYVNLNEAFLNGTEGIEEKVVVYSLVNSLVELEGVEKVQISINGENKYSLGEGMDLSQFLTKDTDLVKE